MAHLGLTDYAEAERVLARINGGTDPALRTAIHLARATALSGMGRSEEAIPHFRAYLDKAKEEETATARADLAIAYAKTKNWPQADEVLGKLRRQAPESDLLLKSAQFLAESALEEKEHRIAGMWFETLVEHGSGTNYFARGLSGLAWTQLERKMVTAAESTFQRLLNECPECEMVNESAMALGKIYEDQKQFERAADMFGRVISGSLESGDENLRQVAQLRQAYNLQRIGGLENLNQAVMLLDEYLASGNAKLTDEALYLKGWANLELKNQVEADAQFDEIYRRYKNSKYWVDSTYRLAERAVRQKEFPVAEAMLAELANRSLGPEVFERVGYLRGQIAANHRNWSEVIKLMRQLSSTTSNKRMYAKSNYWLGESLYQTHQYAEARKLFAQLAEKPELVDENMMPWIMLRFAQCLAHTEQWSDALSVAARGKAMYSTFAAGYEFDYVTGRALARMGRLDDAMNAFRNVIKSTAGGGTETAAMAQWRIGEAYFHQKKYKEAIAEYYRVDSLYSYEKWRAAALIQAGKCQEHLGNWKHAIKLYQQLLQEFPRSEFQQDAKQRLQLATRQARLKTSNETKR